MTPYQEEVFFNKQRFTVVEGATKIGKTFPGIWWLFQLAHGQDPNWFVGEDVDGRHFWWVAPVSSQARTAFERFEKKLANVHGYDILRSQGKQRIITPLGSIIEFKSADKPDSLYSEDVYGAIFDEFTRAKSDAWTAIRSTLTATGGPVKFLGNYKGSRNWGHKLSQKAEDDPKSWYYRKIDAMEAVACGRIKVEEVEQARKDLSKADFDALYMCTGSIDEYVLFNQSDIYDLFTNKHLLRNNDSTRRMACDLAYYGADKFIIHVWEGSVLLKSFEFEKTGSKDIVNHIFRIADEYGVRRSNIAYDATGADWAIDHLENCVPVNFSSRPFNSDYENLRAELYYKLKNDTHDGLLYIADESIKEDVIEQLEYTRRGDSPRGKLKIEGKSQIAALVGGSPDHADTLAISRIFDLKKKYDNNEVDSTDDEIISISF